MNTSKIANEEKDKGCPTVFRFEAQLFEHPEAVKSGGSQIRLSVPQAVSEKLKDMTKIEGTINGHPFRAPLEPQISGGYWIVVNKAMHRGSGADMGATVNLAILGPEPEPTIPTDLRSAFAVSREAMDLWNTLTILGRRDWIRWIESTENPETRARRITRTIEQLSSGKRRPCCVNVNAFMMQCIHG